MKRSHRTISQALVRGHRGSTITNLLVVAAALAGLSALTPTIVKIREAPLTASRTDALDQFYERFGQIAMRQFSRRAEDPSFKASSLAGTFPATPGSDIAVSVQFAGCFEAETLLAYNPTNTTKAEAEALFAQVRQLTPAQVITDGDGQTGGVLLNEPIAHRLPGSAAGNIRVVVYRLSTPDNQTRTVQVAGRGDQCT